jgi:outer membrane immunogenic protein
MAMGIKKMIKKALFASFAVAFGATAANAADIVDTPVSDWSGFYVGVHGGYGGGTFDYPMNVTTDLNSDSDLDESPLDNLDYDFGADLTASGFFGGLQAGWNWQIDSIVLGVEGDIALSDITGEIEIYSDTANSTISGGSTVEWFGTARLRGGFLATSDLLIYATGGLAWGSVNSGYNLDLGGLGGIDDDTTESHMGWTVGGGFEYAVTESISLKTEYLYVDLGDAELLDLDLVTALGYEPIYGTANLSIDQDISFHTVKAGVNFRF